MQGESKLLLIKLYLKKKISTPFYFHESVSFHLEMLHGNPLRCTLGWQTLKEPQQV